MPDDRDQRSNQDPDQKVTDAVNGVPRQSSDNPGDHTVKIQPEQQGLRGGVQGSEQKTVDRADEHINKGADLCGNVPGEQHDEAPQNRPDVQVREPPGGKARQQSGEKHKNIQRV